MPDMQKGFAVRGCKFIRNGDTGEEHGIAFYLDEEQSQQYEEQPMFIVPIGATCADDLVTTWIVIQVGRAFQPIQYVMP